MKAHEICAKAAEIISGDRARTHGDKMQNHANIADAWNAIIRAKARRLGYPHKDIPLVTLDALDVANMLESFKIARRYTGSHNPDDYVDGAGYAAVAGEIADALLMASAQSNAGAAAESVQRGKRG